MVPTKARMVHQSANDETPRDLGAKASIEGSMELHAAELLYRKVLAGSREELTDRHPSTLTSVGVLGMILKEQNKLEEAEPLLREVLACWREQLGDSHRTTLTAQGNLGSMLMLRDGKRAEGEAMVRSALEKLQAAPHSYYDDHFWVVKFRAALR